MRENISNYIHDKWLILKIYRSSHCGSAETNLTSVHEDAGSIPDITQWV